MPTPILVLIANLTHSHLDNDAAHHFTSLHGAMRVTHVLQGVGAVQMDAKLAVIHERLDLAKYSGLPQPALVIGSNLWPSDVDELDAEIVVLSMQIVLSRPIGNYRVDEGSVGCDELEAFSERFTSYEIQHYIGSTLPGPRFDG